MLITCFENTENIKYGKMYSMVRNRGTKKKMENEIRKIHCKREGIVISFVFECGCEKKKKIDLVHKPIPIELSEEMDEVIKMLLWYVPNINSKQSRESELLKNKLYEDFIFEFICEKIGTDRVEDVSFNPDNVFLNRFIKINENRLCVKCQKLVLNKYDNETKIASLLRHLRNMIAHGDFIMTDGFFVGRDISPNGRNVTAFIKMYPKKLLEGLREIANQSSFKFHLIIYGFRKIGYTVIIEPIVIEDRLEYLFEFVLEKNNTKFYIERRLLKRPLVKRDIQMIIRKFELVDDGIRVFMCEEKNISVEYKSWLKKENIIFVGIGVNEAIESLFEGKDILEPYI